jgi:hypothetical protein
VFCCSAPIPPSISQPSSCVSLCSVAALQYLHQSVNHLPFYPCVLLQRFNTSINQSITFLFILVFCCSAPIPQSISQPLPFYPCVLLQRSNTSVNQLITFLFILAFCCNAPVPPSISQPPSFLSLCSVAAVQYLHQSVNHLSFYPCVMLQRSNTSINQSTASFLSLCSVAAVQYLHQSVNHLPFYPSVLFCAALQYLHQSVNHILQCSVLLARRRRRTCQVGNIYFIIYCHFSL